MLFMIAIRTTISKWRFPKQKRKEKEILTREYTFPGVHDQELADN